MALPALITDFNKQTVNYGMAVGESLQKLGQQVGQTLAQQEYQKQAVEALPALQQSMSESIKLIGEGKTGEGYNMLFNTVLSDPRNLTNPILSQVVNLGLQTGKQAGNEFAEQLIARARGATAGISPFEAALAAQLTGQTPADTTGQQPADVVTTELEDADVLAGALPVSDTQQQAAQVTKALNQSLAGGKTFAELLSTGEGGAVFERSQVEGFTTPRPINNLSRYIPGATGVAELNPRDQWKGKSATLNKGRASITFGAEDPNYDAVTEGKKFAANLTTSVSRLDRSPAIQAAIEEYGGFENVPLPRNVSNQKDKFVIYGKDGSVIKDKSGKAVTLSKEEYEAYSYVTSAAALGQVIQNPLYSDKSITPKAPKQETGIDPRVQSAYDSLMKRGVSKPTAQEVMEEMAVLSE